MNRSKIVNSKICQKCGKCCKEFVYVDSYDNALRFKWMLGKKIKIESSEMVNEKGQELWIITFMFPCKKLKQKNGKYYCSVWNGKRPSFCETYPDHIFYDNDPKLFKKIFEMSKKDCPYLKQITFKKAIKTVFGEEIGKEILEVTK